MPNHWDTIYGSIEGINQEIVPYPSGYSGMVLSSSIAPNPDLFTSEELSVVEEVANKLGDKTANALSELSHKEDAWRKYVGHNMLIDYKEAFSLKAL